MRTAIGSDHAGFELKSDLVPFLQELGDVVIDVGSHSTEPVDYPDIAELVAREIIQHRADRGVLICGSGIGASVAANKIEGIRAGVCHDTYSAHQGVEHDNMNILVLGARVIGIAMARELVGAFAGARFTNEERHVRRLKKVHIIEERAAAKSRSSQS